MASPDIEPLFQQTLARDYNDPAAWDAVNALRRPGSREVFDRAVAWLASEDPLKRARGADILAQFGVTEEQPAALHPEESFAVLSGLLAYESEPRPLASALTALGHLHDPRALALFLKFHDHPAHEVRLAVAFALGGFAGDPAAIRALIRLTTDGNGEVRNWATFSLGVEGDADAPEIRDALAARLKDGNEDARLEALVGLARRRDHRVLPQLLKTLAKRDVSVGEIEAACYMLEMAEDRRDWKSEDYAKALRERFGITG